MAELKITKNNFESEVLRSEVPVLLDLWATWCPPCRMLSPEEPELAAMFRVENIPTMVVMKEGKVAELAVGYRPKEQITDMLERA